MNLNKRKNLLLFSLAAETFLGSYGLLFGEHTGVDSILYIGASLTFIIAILLMPETRVIPLSVFKNELPWKLFLLAIMIGIAVLISRYWLFRIPLDPDYADMLPVIKVMNERFLQSGVRKVYDPIPEIWNGTTPIYLPFMWLPYAPAVALNVDMRWTTVIMVLISFSIILFSIRVRGNRYFGFVFLLMAAVLFWWIFARNDMHSLISMSEEGVVIFYFVLLTTAIISGNILFIGITASLCLLSRYSMIGWLLPFLIFLAARKEFRKGIIFSIIIGSSFLLFFLIPFGYKTMEQMVALPGNYIAFARHIWEVSPEVFWLNPGLAKFYGSHGILMLHRTLLTATFIVPVLFAGIFLVQKKWKIHNLQLACFKLSLLTFYQFIDVPYGYLFFTGSFVSFVIAANLLSTEGTSDL